jgi:hypothetical protein
MMYCIHYRESDGEMFGYETGTVDPVAQPGLAITYAELDETPDPVRRRIDTATMTVVDKAGAEPLPSLRERLQP